MWQAVNQFFWKRGEDISMLANDGLVSFAMRLIKTPLDVNQTVSSKKILFLLLINALGLRNRPPYFIDSQ
jgi:hypothetical protein